MDENKKIEITLKAQQDKARVNINFIALGQCIRSMKKAAIILTVLALLGGSTVGIIQNILHASQKVQLLVGFGFAGIEDGKDPVGGTFDIRKMSAPVVVIPALERTGLKDSLDVDAVRNAITFQSLIPQNILDRIGVTRFIAESDVSALEDLLDISYHPSEYLLILDLKQIDLEIDKGTQLLDTIAQTYQDWFLAIYSYQGLFTEVPSEEYKDYDYSEMTDILMRTSSAAQRFVQEMADSTLVFRSTETGFSFSDLIGILETLQQVDIASIRSIILANHLTKDEDAMRARYAYRIRTTESKLAAMTEQLASMDETIENYQRGTTTIIHDDSGAATSVVADSDTYDLLITQRIDIAGEISTLRSMLTQLRQDYMEISAPSSESSAANVQEKVEEMLTSVSERLNNCIEQINVTTQDYYKTVAYRDAVRVKVPAHPAQASPSSVVKTCVLYTLIASVAGWFALGMTAVLKSLLSGELLQKQDQDRSEHEFSITKR